MVRGARARVCERLPASFWCAPSRASLPPSLPRSLSRSLSPTHLLIRQVTLLNEAAVSAVNASVEPVRPLPPERHAPQLARPLPADARLVSDGRSSDFSARVQRAVCLSVRARALSLSLTLTTSLPLALSLPSPPLLSLSLRPLPVAVVFWSPSPPTTVSPFYRPQRPKP